MPIKIPNQRPATKTLTEENIFVMTETRAITQDIRPLQILLLNLMPAKADTETQLARVLGNTPLQIELDVRMITLTWNHPNGIGYPNLISTKEYKDLYHINTQDGLTDFGIEYVREMERLGIIIDVSHLGDAGFYDVLKYTTKPFVASHINARSVCGVARNMSDDMIKLLAKRNGVMGINFCGDFLKASKTGGVRSCVEDMVKHILYIRDLVGIDYVGLGSDFDGISQDLELKDASMMPMLKDALFEAGLKEEEIEKVFYKNVLRLYQTIL